MSRPLFESFSLAGLTLKNRIVMAPMTRSRSPGNIPADIVATYYAQRSEAGLIISEGTSPSPNGLGYSSIPGIFNAEQVAGWKTVTQAVHAAGGKIFVQLMHTGRVGHPANLPAGARILGPSAVAAPGEMFTVAHGPQPHPVPEVMTGDDIATAIGEYENAAALAIEAGFDGVEIHGANGYLVEQFLNVASNQRTDAWGGSVAGRAHFALEVARKVSARIGANRTGIRLSPYGAFNGTQPQDADTDALYAHLATELGALKLAYIHVVDHSSMGAPPVPEALKATIRANFGGTYILSGGYADAARAEADLAAGKGDLVAYGRPFLANPRLPSKLARGAELLMPDFGKLYTPGPEGYCDYPVEG